MRGRRASESSRMVDAIAMLSSERGAGNDDTPSFASRRRRSSAMGAAAALGIIDYSSENASRSVTPPSFVRRASTSMEGSNGLMSTRKPKGQLTDSPACTRGAGPATVDTQHLQAQVASVLAEVGKIGAVQQGLAGKLEAVSAKLDRLVDALDQKNSHS